MLECFSAGVTERWNVIVEKEILYKLPQRDERTPPQRPAHTQLGFAPHTQLKLPRKFCFPISLSSRARFCPVESVPPTGVWATPNTALLSPEVSTLPPTCSRCTDNLALPRACACGWQMYRAQGSSRLGAFTCPYGSGFWFQGFVSSFWASVVNSFKNHLPNLGMRYTEIVLR